METPEKSGSPEYRLITPLRSMTKSKFLSKLDRQSLDTIEMGKNFSPEGKENILKRHANDRLVTNPTKLFKLSNISASKVRTALFQDKINEFNLDNFSLNTKRFYSSCKKSEQPFVNNLRNSVVKRRQSHPVQYSSPDNSYKRSLRRQKFGKINAGVFHGIKKPKSKINLKIMKKVSQNNMQSPKNSTAEQVNSMKMNTIENRVSSPEIDESKRFFKTNRTIRTNQAATVTVNNKIKLKVANGKIALNPKCVFPMSKTHKQLVNAIDISYDTADLTVDEPEVEATLEQDKVANILKILEDDWADDDYDTMETLVAIGNTVSSLKPTALSQDTMINEFNNTTSTMNIKENIASLTNIENLSLDNDNNHTAEIGKESEKKYFPLFDKEYFASDNDFRETNIKPTKVLKRNIQSQLSMKRGTGENQYQLDFGQKRFGATQCPECSVVYQLGDPEDENAHLNYHNSRRILKFQGWKTERVVMEDIPTSSRIILVEPHDPKQYWKKVLEILTVVDKDLGLVDIRISDYQDKRVFLYIREKNVLGVLVAEHIKIAYRMIPELVELDCCTSETTPTKCGINVVWTAMTHRRQGIATKLMDILRTKFFYGYFMSFDDIAFSTPSPSGKIFAEKYTKTRNFKVYN